MTNAARMSGRQGAGVSAAAAAAVDAAAAMNITRLSALVRLTPGMSTAALVAAVSDALMVHSSARQQRARTSSLTASGLEGQRDRCCLITPAMKATLRGAGTDRDVNFASC